MQYTTIKVPSGVEVEIRPRSYEEWEKHEDARLDAMNPIPALLDDGKRPEAEAILQRTYRNSRSLRLATWVKDFSKMKGKLTMRDIAEIEKAVEALEAVEVTGGNSVTGGDGQ